ncbi:MAG TPA: methyltransferase [Nitrosopumilaceae archaeon]|nr:methyltransferase [Nitrosopumilaceae archaeon]
MAWIVSKHNIKKQRIFYVLYMSDFEKILDIIIGRWRSQILYAGVKLGIFDLVTSVPMSSADIAKKLNLDPALSYRLLRALGSIGLLKEDQNQSFSITSMGQFLSADNPQTLKGVTLLEEGPEHYAIWKHLPAMIKEGKQDGFVREFGRSIFDYLVQNPNYADVFSKAMSSYSATHSRLVLEALDGFDFSKIQSICDVGGGHGYLICNLLLKYKNLKGIVLELERVIKDKELLWANKMGIGDRCNYTSGNMFEKVPSADAYVMKMILHDWNDDECVKILSNIQRAAPKGGRLFIVEHIVPGPDVPHFSKLFDIHMLCALTGRERTEKEFPSLLEQAGFRHVRTHYPQSKTIGVIEAIKA